MMKFNKEIITNSQKTGQCLENYFRWKRKKNGGIRKVNRKMTINRENIGNYKKLVNILGLTN